MVGEEKYTAYCQSAGYYSHITTKQHLLFHSNPLLVADLKNSFLAPAFGSWGGCFCCDFLRCLRRWWLIEHDQRASTGQATEERRSAPHLASHSQSHRSLSTTLLEPFASERALLARRLRSLGSIVCPNPLKAAAGCSKDPRFERAGNGPLIDVGWFGCCEKEPGS